MTLRSINALKRRRLHLAAFACALALLTSIGVGTAQGEGFFSLSDGDDNGAIKTAIADQLSDEGHVRVPGDPTRSAPRDQMPVQLKDFYAARDDRPAWTGSDDALSHADEATHALANAYEQGLKPSDYLSYLAPWSKAPTKGEDAAKFDIALTKAMLIYALDLHSGRYAPFELYKDATLPPDHFDAATALNAALRDDSIKGFLDQLPPQHPGYKMLVQELAHYRSIASKGGWGILKAGADSKSLAKRLALEDSNLADATDVSDQDLTDALVRYQRRNGLPDDGALGPDTLSALNVPAGVRVNEIVANMERWRWVPKAFERRYILVNVPDQSAQFIEDGRSLLYTKVIIGKAKTPTPIMRAVVTTVIANPPWDIPDDIAARELTKKCRADADCLASHHLQMATAEDGSFGLQQMPGDDNALGQIMLDAPNGYGVYMHDTPHKNLFDAKVREFSNGCIRTQKIFQLATLTMGMDADDPNITLVNAIGTKDTQRLTLDEPVPLYVLYWTAAAYDDGMHFRPDRYGRDALLIARMGESAKPAHQKPEKGKKPARKELVAGGNDKLAGASDKPAAAQ